MAAVDDEGLAGDERRGVGDVESDQVGHLVRPAEPAATNLLDSSNRPMTPVGTTAKALHELRKQPKTLTGTSNTEHTLMPMSGRCRGAGRDRECDSPYTPRW
jgi:hypothetical protein